MSLKVRHLGLLDPISSSLRIAGWDVDEDFEDDLICESVHGEEVDAHSAAGDREEVIRPAGDDDFDRRALIDSQ